MIHSTIVQVPGSTSNIGPGYDCLGIALALYNRVTVTRLEDGAGAGGRPGHVMVADSAQAFFARSGKAEFPFGWTIGGEVPVSRGLGSSVTLRMGVLMGLNELAEKPLGRQELFELCTELEGHPDNAGPGAFGGFVLAGPAGGVFRFDVDERLIFVLLIPDYEVLTEPAREVLPDSVPRIDAARNAANAAIIAAAFATGRYEQARGAFEDFLHQPYRRRLVPGMDEAIAAGTEAGALGGFLSGSGSTIACLACDSEAEAREIGAAMKSSHPAFSGAEISLITADNRGAQVLESE